MQDKLRRVLHAISCKNPYVGYVQGMNFLAGFLLLNYSEDDSFKLFIKIKLKFTPFCHIDHQTFLCLLQKFHHLSELLSSQEAF